MHVVTVQPRNTESLEFCVSAGWFLGLLSDNTGARTMAINDQIFGRRMDNIWMEAMWQQRHLWDIAYLILRTAVSRYRVTLKTILSRLNTKSVPIAVAVKKVRMISWPAIRGRDYRKGRWEMRCEMRRPNKMGCQRRCRRDAKAERG